MLSLEVKNFNVQVGKVFDVTNIVETTKDKQRIAEIIKEQLECYHKDMTDKEILEITDKVVALDVPVVVETGNYYEGMLLTTTDCVGNKVILIGTGYKDTVCAHLVDTMEFEIDGIINAVIDQNEEERFTQYAN